MSSDAIGSRLYKEKVLVVALNIGNERSNYAFALTCDYNSCPTKVSCNGVWPTGSTTSILSLTTPTCILFDENQQFHSFGYEAENRYTELALDGEHERWHFVKISKSNLYGNTRTIEDDRGRKMSAKMVFGESIKYLKNHLIERLKKPDTGLGNEDIHWVLPVPADCSNTTIQLIREAANLAGIDDGQLSIVSKPVAASLYCQMLLADNLKHRLSQEVTPDITMPGSKFMVLDLGDDNFDITVHERQADGNLCELHNPFGGPWGGTRVDEEFFQMLINIVGPTVFDKFKKEHKEEFYDLQRQLKTKKRETVAARSKISIKMALQTLYTDEEKIKEGIDNSPYKGQIVWIGDKIRINTDLFESLFNNCAENILDSVNHLLSEPNVNGIDILLMTGPFSESPIIQDALMKALPDWKIFIPAEAEMTVLKGAVIFGHQPKPVLNVSRAA